MPSSESHPRLAMSYVLWGLGFLGVAGLHRFYNGKIVTGLIWLFTGGLFFIGQLIDVFFVPGMVEDYQLKKLKAKYGTNLHNLLNGHSVSVQALKQPTREEKMVKLLKAAQSRTGELSVTQAVMDTGMSFEETESLLKDMVKSGYAAVDNHPKTGIVIYQFEELMS